MESSHHDNELLFSVNVWPCPLDFFCQCIEWLVDGHHWHLAWINEIRCLFNQVHTVFYHC